jgi:methionyl-tRNA formyltransferase
MPGGATACGGEVAGTSAPLRFVLVGEGTLPIACGELLLERGHEIVALASPDSHVVHWGRRNGIRRSGAPALLESLAGHVLFDYLLSIVNFRKLPGPLLRAAGRMAINYHDSPLPRYAGMHATSWALLHGEERHAVTWHVMEERLDAGAIVKQVPVEIDPGDTALTLNLKCYEAAVAGFTELLDDMEADAVRPRVQQCAGRSFFRMHQRPPAGCTLSFASPAHELDALVRALDFGPYRNPLGLAKLALGAAFAIVTELEVLPDRSRTAPGTIVAVDEDALVVGTATSDVVLAGLATIDGRPFALDDLAHGVPREGARIGALAPERSARLTQLCAEVAPFESFWSEQLARARPTLASGASTAAAPVPAATRDARIVRVALRGAGAASGTHGTDAAIAAAVGRLAAATGRDVAVAYGDARLRADIGDLDGFFSTCVPLCVPWRAREVAGRFDGRVAAALARVRENRTYPRDLAARMPALRARVDEVDPRRWPVAVLADLPDALGAPMPEGRVLEIHVDAGANVALRFDPSRVSPDVVAAIATGPIAPSHAPAHADGALA